MKWLVEKPALTIWHKHFTWTPVEIGEYRYWLCFVMRKAIKVSGDDPEGSIAWEYTTADWY